MTYSGCGGSHQRTRLGWAILPVKRENTGKFRRSSREGVKTARFSDYKSAGYAKIPYAPEQGIAMAYKAAFMARHDAPILPTPAGWNFRKGQVIE